MYSQFYTYGDTTWKDKLTAFDDIPITYDTIGKPLNYYNGTAWEFTWANGRQLVAAAKTGTNITYTYDLAGIRDSKTVNDVTYHYLTQNGQVVRQVWTEGTVDHVMDFIYDNNGAPYAMKYDGTEYYYVLNLQGDVIRIIDTTGASVAEYIYDAWGRPVSATGTMAEVNPIRYRGYYFDSDSGLYYLQSRYYDPVIKRFINADSYASTGQGFLGINMFAYCRNNPVIYADPTGQYDRDKAVSYAQKWYRRHNSKYYFYSRGDCANFASQCLYAGGVKMTDKWYVSKSLKKSLSLIDRIKACLCSKFRYDWKSGSPWRLANDQYKYFSDPNNGYINGDVITISSADDIASVAATGGIQPGDLVYFSSDGETVHHAAIVTKVDEGMIYYAAHSVSAFDKPLSSSIGGETVFIIRINDDA